MYAVFQSGGKQHRVTEGQTLRLEKLDLETGATIEFTPLMIANGEVINIGAPLVEGGKVAIGFAVFSVLHRHFFRFYESLHCCVDLGVGKYN